MNIPKGATHIYELKDGSSIYLKRENDRWLGSCNESHGWSSMSTTTILMAEPPIREIPKKLDNVNSPTHYTQGKVDENNHYYINVAGLDEIDFYIIARLYGITDPNIQHTLKKLLAIGKRSGGKSESQDIQDCINQLKRKLEIDKLLDTTNKQL